MQALVLERSAPKVRVVDLVWVLLLAFNLTEFVLTWLRVLYGWLWPILNLPPTPPIALLDPPSARAVFSTLLTAHIGLFVAVFGARAIAFAASRITIKYDGLLMQCAFGQRWIPDDALRGLRSIELPNERFVVWVDAAKGLPLQNWLAPLLFGRWAWRGFMLTSYSEHFDDAVAHIVLRLKQKYGEEKFADHFKEEKPNWLLRLISAPFATVHAVAKTEPPLFTLRQATWQMSAVSGALMLPLLVAALIHLQVPWGALVVPWVAMGEWPLASIYIAALSEGYARKLTFQEAMRLYPVTQLPRWLIAFALTLLVIAGWPFLLYVPVFIPAIGIGALLTLKLTEALFEIEFPDSTLGIFVTIIYQAIVFGIFLALLPR